MARWLYPPPKRPLCPPTLYRAVQPCAVPITTRLQCLHRTQALIWMIYSHDLVTYPRARASSPYCFGVGGGDVLWSGRAQKKANDTVVTIAMICKLISL